MKGKSCPNSGGIFIGYSTKIDESDFRNLLNGIL